MMSLFKWTGSPPSSDHCGLHPVLISVEAAWLIVFFLKSVINGLIPPYI